MKEDIERFEPRTPSVTAVGRHRIRAWVGEQRPHLDATLWVGDVATRIASLVGSREIEALAFDTRGMAVGDPVRCSGEVAAWPAPREGAILVEDLSFELARNEPIGAAPDVQPGRPTNIRAIDELLPLAENGVTLLLDAGAPDACVDQLLRGPLVCASARRVPAATHQVVGDEGLARVVAARWAAELGVAALFIEADPFDLDELLPTGITAIVRVRLRGGLEILAETLDLGHSDSSILLRADGTIDLERSYSRLRPRDPRLDRIGAIRERLAIFGEDDVEPEDLALLREVAELERGLVAASEPR